MGSMFIDIIVKIDDEVIIFFIVTVFTRFWDAVFTRFWDAVFA